VEVAEALGGLFLKLVTLAPRTVREMPKETQKNGDTNKSKRTYKHVNTATPRRAGRIYYLSSLTS